MKYRVGDPTWGYMRAKAFLMPGAKSTKGLYIFSIDTDKPSVTLFVKSDAPVIDEREILVSKVVYSTKDNEFYIWPLPETEHLFESLKLNYRNLK